MNYLDIKNGPSHASRIILGCMRMPSLSVKDAVWQIEKAVEEGINFFDHATCYGNGEAEDRFGDAMKDGKIELAKLPENAPDLKVRDRDSLWSRYESLRR